jgi:4,5-dihydroxyphthalate decarboxylase
MANLNLHLAITDNPRTRPIIDGRVTVDGVDLTKTVLGPAEMFWRQLNKAEFDVSELSMSELMIIRSRDDQRFVGLPIFTTRRFYHTGIYVRKDAKIDKPADLKGKRIGVPEYIQTSALWTRGVLDSEFGVATQDMIYFMERLPNRSHAGAIGFELPKWVQRIPADKSIGSMIVAGEIDAAMSYNRHSDVIDRSTVDLDNHPDIRPLFADNAAECARYYKKTGTYPINHGMVVKREIFEKNPWIAINIVKAFQQANAIAERERQEQMHYHFETGLVPAEYRATVARPLIAHGLRANREVLELAARYSNQQGLTPRVMTMEELFAPNALGS